MKEKKNSSKAIIILVCAALVAVVGWRVYSVHFATNTDEHASEEIEQIQQTSLNQHQKELMDAYTASDWEFIKLLSSNLWTTNNDSTSLVFDDESFYNIVDGQRGESTPYAISALSKTQVSADGETINEYTCSFETNSGTHILKLQQSQADETLMSLSCDAFRSGAYIRAAAATSFEVKGVPEQAYSLLGNNKDSLESALREYCSVNYPTVYEATCSEVVTIDYAEGVIEIPFALNNNAKSQVTLIYQMNDKTFSVSALH